MSSENPWSDAQRIIESAVQVQIEQDLPLNYLNWQPLGSFGDEVISQKRIKNVQIAQSSADFRRNVDTVNFEGRKLNTAYLNRELQFTWRHAEQITKLGGMEASDLKLIEALYFGAIKQAFQGTTAEAHGVAIEGITAAGSGTYASPYILDGSTTAGKWDVAGKSMLDMGTLIELLENLGAPRPYVLSIPSSAAGLFTFPVNSSYDKSLIIQQARELFEHVILTGNDHDSVNLITGAAETKINCQIYAWSMPDMRVLYQLPLGTRTLPWDSKEEIGLVRSEGMFTVAPVARAIGTTYYKSIVEIDAIDLTT